MKEIKGIEFRIKNVLKKEYVELEMNKAEQEAQKAQNMISFSKEIYNRPKREWIVTEKEKRELREKSKKEKIN